MTLRRRIGILGGTFDPVHIGHLHIAMCAKHDLGLDEVVLMPAGSPPHKPDQPVTDATTRLEMIDTAIRNVPGLVSSDLDIGAHAPSYTSDLLQTYRIQHPDTDLWFIIGSDSLRDFPGWHEPNAILSQARLAVAERPGWPIDQLLDHPEVPALRASVDRFSSVPIALSATTIRERIGMRLPVDWLVPQDVLTFIERAAWYRKDHLQ